MAGAQLQPASMVPATSGSTFPYVFVGAGANSKYEQVMGVAASISANCQWDLRFDIPATLPSGTCKLVLKMITSSTTGSGSIQPQMATVGDGSSLSAATLTNEATVTLTASTAGAYIANRTAVTNTTVTASQTLVCRLNFLTSGWAITNISGFRAYLSWE